jgi:hypothetical protein
MEWQHLQYRGQGAKPQKTKVGYALRERRKKGLKSFSCQLESTEGCGTYQGVIDITRFFASLKIVG